MDKFERNLTSRIQEGAEGRDMEISNFAERSGDFKRFQSDSPTSFILTTHR